MPWPHPTVPSPKLALAGWCPLSPTGAQTTQLLAVLWDQVTLTCQGSGATGATTWYKDGQRWWQEGPVPFTVTESDPLVLQVPAQELLEGDTLKLHCQCCQDNHLTRVRFYREEKDLRGSFRRTELFLSPLQLHHSGRYQCEGLVGSWQSRSAPVTVRLFSVPVLEGPPELTVGFPLNLSCCSSPSPLQPQGPLLHMFYWEGQVVGGPQVSLQLLVPAMGVHSEERSVRKSSNRLLIMLCATLGTPGIHTGSLPTAPPQLQPEPLFDIFTLFPPFWQPRSRDPVRLLSRLLQDMQDFWGYLRPLLQGTK
uniref:Ig-like domain-containing protein n=1 Tax=Zonotrichia albicollis TaxID=44394 RepID=A0A8D2MAC9_ZONAL